MANPKQVETFIQRYHVENTYTYYNVYQKNLGNIIVRNAYANGNVQVGPTLDCSSLVHRYHLHNGVNIPHEFAVPSMILEKNLIGSPTLSSAARKFYDTVDFTNRANLRDGDQVVFKDKNDNYSHTGLARVTQNADGGTRVEIFHMGYTGTSINVLDNKDDLFSGDFRLSVAGVVRPKAVFSQGDNARKAEIELNTQLANEQAAVSAYQAKFRETNFQNDPAVTGLKDVQQANGYSKCEKWGHSTFPGPRP